MGFRSSPISHKEFGIITAAVAVVVIVSAVSFYFWGPFYLNENSEGQLKLVASESSDSILSGQNVTLKMEVYNTGPTSIFNVSDTWPTVGGVNNRLMISPCSEDIPYGFAIIKGYTTNTSLSSERPLYTWQPGVYYCPVIFPVTSYEITGLSHDGFILSSANQPIPITLSSTITLSGYYAETNSLSGTYNFVHFPVSQYTVVVADEWGATVLLHFDVT